MQGYPDSGKTEHPKHSLVFRNSGNLDTGIIRGTGKLRGIWNFWKGGHSNNSRLPKDAGKIAYWENSGVHGKFEKIDCAFVVVLEADIRSHVDVHVGSHIKAHIRIHMKTRFT